MAQITDAKTSAITDTGAAAAAVAAAGLEIKLRPKNFSWSDIRGFPPLRSDIFKRRTYFGRVSVATQLNRTSSQQISQGELWDVSPPIICRDLILSDLRHVPL